LSREFSKKCRLPNIGIVTEDLNLILISLVQKRFDTSENEIENLGRGNIIFNKYWYIFLNEKVKTLPFMIKT